MSVAKQSVITSWACVAFRELLYCTLIVYSLAFFSFCSSSIFLTVSRPLLFLRSLVPKKEVLLHLLLKALAWSELFRDSFGITFQWETDQSLNSHHNFLSTASRGHDGVIVMQVGDATHFSGKTSRQQKLSLAPSVSLASFLFTHPS